MHKSRLDLMILEEFNRLNASDIYLGPWANERQHPGGVARFIFKDQKAEMTFIEALNLRDVLSDIDESSCEETWRVIKDFSDSSEYKKTEWYKNDRKT